MSIFTDVTLACPVCGREARFPAVRSVNADRRADLRAAILDGSFQRTTCVECTTTFRLEPELSFINADRGTWIAARPLTRLADWPEQEREAAEAFERVYGATASPVVQAIGRSVRPRVTFGWAALREKLVIDAQRLDDVTVELAKAAVLRLSPDAPIARGHEMRLVGVDADDGALLLAWLHAASEAVDERKRYSRDGYDAIAADADGEWSDLRRELTAGPFVDLGRLTLADS